MQLAAAILILVYSIVLHEVSHGWVAYLNGDSTAKDGQRLTLNPIPHIDPLGTIFIPAFLVLIGAPFLIGWARPVPIDERNFRNESLGLFSVAIAGPLVNLLLAVYFAWVYKDLSSQHPLAPVFYYGAGLNVMLALFNLLPIPPLDGSKVIGAFLPAGVRRLFLSLDPIGLFIVIALMSLGFFHKYLLPVYQQVLTALTR